MIRNQILVKVLIIFYLNKRQILSNCDCGLPAIPETTKLSVFKSRYEEQSVISYECEDNNNELIEGKYRICANHQWNGSLPRCANEVASNLLKRIEITELGRPHKLYREMQLSPRRSAKIVNSNAKHFDCPKSKYLWNITRSQSWTFQIIRGYYFNYFVLYMRYGSLLENQMLNKLSLSANMEDIISSNVCRIEKFILLNDSITYKIGFVCDKIEQKLETHEGIDESIQKIIINVEVNGVINVTTTFCDMKFYILSETCGSPEKPLNSLLLAREKTYSVFSCREGFHLDGVQKVRCGPEGTWIDPFPMCRPNNTCKIPAMERDDPHLHIQYKHFYTLNGSIFAVPDDLAIYSCIDTINGTYVRMEGLASRVCKDGKWSGTQPMCQIFNTSNTMRTYAHMDLAKDERSKAYSSTRLFVIVMAMFGSFSVGGVCVAIVLFLIARKRRKIHKRPKISIVIDECNENDYDRPQEYSTFRVSQSSHTSNEILNPLYEDFQKYGSPLNIPFEEENTKIQN